MAKTPCHLFVFSLTSSRENFNFSFRSLYNLYRLILSLFSCVSAMLECSGFAIVGQLGSGGDILLFSLIKYSLTLVFTHLFFQPLWPVLVPVFPTGVVCTCANEDCWDFWGGLATGRMHSCVGLGDSIGVGGTEYSGWQDGSTAWTQFRHLLTSWWGLSCNMI